MLCNKILNSSSRYPDTFKSRCKSAEVSPENKASKPKIVKDSSSKSVVDHVGDKQSFEEIVEIHRSDPHFPFVLLEKTLFVSGWYKCPVPKNVRYAYLYVLYEYFGEFTFLLSSIRSAHVRSFPLLISRTGLRKKVTRASHTPVLHVIFSKVETIFIYTMI